jgi:signal transduction histidine kinase
MFPAEVTAVFANLLTNAVKAAGQKGRIRARGRSGKEAVSVTIENTGAAVSLDEAERWFLPFESTTTTVDPVLGQGMGLGLPITRRIVEEYGGEVIFARPATGYATAVRLTLPE